MPSPTPASWRGRARSPCVPSGPPSGTAWPSPRGPPWSRSARNSFACRARRTLPGAGGRPPGGVPRGSPVDDGGMSAAGTAESPSPRLHALNTGFHWHDHTGPFRVVSTEQARQYDELGYFVLEDALAAPEINELLAQIDPFEHRQEEALRQMEGGRFFIPPAHPITFP